MTVVPVEVELGESIIAGQRWASVTVGGVTMFSEIVYDNPENPAERNILLLFGSRLRALLEDD